MPTKCKHALKGKKSHCNLPSDNKWDYVGGVLSLLETEKLTLHAMSKLECHETHKIKHMDPIEDPDAETRARNDDFFRIFRKLEGKPASYMCSWLGFFVMIYYWFFVSRANMHLKSKDLKLEWMESIKASRCGDILVLYGLCLLTDSHCVIYLNRNCIFSSLEHVQRDHALLMERCEVHLCCAGNSAFIQLTPREIPMPSSQDHGVKMEVLETLMVEESSTLSILMKEGLSKPKAQQADDEQKPKPCVSVSASSADDLP